MVVQCLVITTHLCLWGFMPISRTPPLCLAFAAAVANWLAHPDFVYGTHFTSAVASEEFEDEIQPMHAQASSNGQEYGLILSTFLKYNIILMYI